MFLFNSVIDIFLMAALIPPIVLLVYIYSLDKIEPEPPGLVLKLVLLGACSIIPTIVLETIGQDLIMPRFFAGASPLVRNIFLYFIVVACSEEGMKLLFLKKGCWYDPNFNYRFDAIVYAVSVGLGFAAGENIEYVFAYGLSTALVRAVTAIPGHCIFAIYMGYYYGMAKYNDFRGRGVRRRFYLTLAYVIPVLLHGFYDFCASSSDNTLTLWFFIYIIVLDIIAFISVKHFAAKDAPL
jgi:RsiW-degrading membrane proteinase PrsW (M82 family)